MPTIDEDLSQIERDIRTLKIEYEQFFGGGRSRPPADTQWRVDTLVRRYNERTGELSYRPAIPLQQSRRRLTQSTWTCGARKRCKRSRQRSSIISAPPPRPWKRSALARPRCSQAAEPSKIVAPPPLDFRAAEAAAHADAVHQTASAFAMSFSNPEHEKEKVYTLYEKLIEARSETGERSSTPSLQDFERFVQQKTKDLKDKGGREIEYTVSVEGGRVKLKARVSS